MVAHHLHVVLVSIQTRQTIGMLGQGSLTYQTQEGVITTHTWESFQIPANPFCRNPSVLGRVSTTALNQPTFRHDGSKEPRDGLSPFARSQALKANRSGFTILCKRCNWRNVGIPVRTCVAKFSTLRQGCRQCHAKNAEYHV